MVAIFQPLVDQQLFCTPSCRFAAPTILVMRLPDVNVQACW
jgi:hypothetical protein